MLTEAVRACVEAVHDLQEAQRRTVGVGRPRAKKKKKKERKRKEKVKGKQMTQYVKNEDWCGN